MILIVEIIIFLVVLLSWWIYNDQKHYSKYPPGPTRIPLLGSMIQVIMQSDFPAISFQKLGKIYGDVFFIKAGENETVVFNSPDAIREMLTHDLATGRYQFEVIRVRHNDKNRGIVWGYGKPWHNLRRYTIRNLRDFGFGKSSTMDVVVNEEVETFLEHLRQQTSKAKNNIIHVEDMFNLAALNGLWRLVSGKSFEYSDPKLRRLLQLNSEFMATTNFAVDLGQSWPILRTLFPEWTGKTIQQRTSEDLFDYGKDLLNEQRQMQATGAENDTFISMFTDKVNQSKDDVNTDFTDEQFVMTILDLILAGSDTSSKTLTFGILYMLLNPEVQEKVQKEIDHVISDDKFIEYTMKSKMPYTNATLLEIMRYSTIGPTPVPREATEEFYFRGFLIKKGVSLLPNIYNAHFDERVWGDPQVFRPERFLNSSGTEIDQSVADKLLSFGAGKRFCLGQSLAETTIFMYFTAVMRRFKFVKVPGTNPSVKPVLGITLSPQPFDVQVLERKINKQIS